ncbi:MAG: ATP-dependent sacrificial sulfur transferase LarE [Smithellaceae bacterium]
MEIESKLNNLKKHLKQLSSIAVAYSGGVDSTFLLKIAHDVLGDKVIAVTARSSTYPEREFRDAVKFVREMRISHQVVSFNELDVPGFADNLPERCYFCKREFLSKVVATAHEHNIRHVVEGSNVDDRGDYRPGMQAVRELGVASPLQEAGLGKEEIRILSRKMDLPTWNKPAFACLASRFPYGQKITRDKLQVVDQAEQFLMDLGLRQVRVRHHGEIARIEVSPEERSFFFDTDLMDKIYEKFKQLGFLYTALDLKGYRTGSMNETINVSLQDREQNLRN